MQKMKIALGLAALAGLAFTPTLARSSGGGGEPKEGNKTVQLAELPLAAQKTLLERANGATIQRIVPSPVFYVIEITLEGRPFAVWVNESGTALEGPGPLRKEADEYQGTTIAWPDLPPAVQNLISTKFQGIRMGEIRKSPVVYVATLQQGVEEWPIRVTQDGQLLPLVRRMRHGEGKAPDDEENKVRLHQEKEQAFLKERHRPESQEGPMPHRRAPKE